MSTLKLIVFRFFNYSLCRYDWSALLFKKLLIKLLIEKKTVPYSPSSHYFYITDLETHTESFKDEQ